MHLRSDNRVFYLVLRKESFPAKERKGNSLFNTVPRDARKSSERKEKKIKSFITKPKYRNKTRKSGYPMIYFNRIKCTR